MSDIKREDNGFIFKTEVGAIISEDDDVLAYVMGDPGKVDFPEEFIWDLHKRRPGFVYELAHTHPPHMRELSSRDRQTLKTWCFALYPFPLRMSTITITGRLEFTKTTYLGLLEPKDLWKSHGGPRNFEILKEHQYQFYTPPGLWVEELLKRSYGSA